MTTARSQGHFESLDGLRGAAALAVVIHHSANVYLGTETRNLGLFTPVLHALARLGHPAVLLFFVLSGFVLYVSFLRGHDRSYRSFLLRRIFRLYPALIVAVAGAALLHWLQSPRDCSAFDPWVASCWCHDLTVGGTLRIMSLLGLRAEDNLFNPVLWSLFIEMRFSIVFMLLAALCQRSWIIIIGIGAASYLVGAHLLARLGYHEPFLMGDSLPSATAVTLFYLPSFILGMLVADVLHKRVGYKYWPKSNWIKLGIVASLTALGLAANSDILREFVFSAIIFCICLGGWFDALLRSRPFLFLGRASYSLYLIHLPILFAMTYWLQPKIGIAAVVLIAPVVSVIVARAMYSLIEVPCISAGRTVAGLFARRPLASDFALRESTAVVQSGSHVPRPSDGAISRHQSDLTASRLIVT
jgi:peptidoglycan/LPS O-acetylase OafA/YrhL